jgi:hypothetical protein
MHEQDVEVTATLQAMRELRGHYAPLSRLQCIVVALLEIWRAGPLLDKSLPRDVRIASLKLAAATAIACARRIP